MSAHHRAVLQGAARVAQHQNVEAYLVGGLVRDLMLERPGKDLDLAIEGDGKRFASALADELGGAVQLFPEFLTATVVGPQGEVIDVASTRTEVYERPGALPEVRSGTLREDLFRRDFTVNAMAIRIAPPEAVELLDFFGGLDDLEQRRLAVLHPGSFTDDPTRILRGIRLERSLGFAFDPETHALAQAAGKAESWASVSRDRWMAELEALWVPLSALPEALRRLSELHLLRALHSELEWTEEFGAWLAGLRVSGCWWEEHGGLLDERLLAWLGIASWLGETKAGAMAELWGVSREQKRALAECSNRIEAAERALKKGGWVDRLGALEPLIPEELVILHGGIDNRQSALLQKFVEHWDDVRRTIRGQDLIDRGVPQGKWIGEAVRATRAALLDGSIQPGDEFDHALGIAHRARAVGGP